MGEQFPVEEEAHGVLGDLAGSPSHKIITEAQLQVEVRPPQPVEIPLPRLSLQGRWCWRGLPTGEEASKAAGQQREAAQAAPEAQGGCQGSLCPWGDHSEDERAPSPWA